MNAPVYCIHCGATIPVSAQFCPTCGGSQAGAAGPSAARSGGNDLSAPAPGASPSTTAVATRPSNAPLLILVLVLAVGGVGAFVVFGQSKLSDAASVWCTDNGDPVITVGMRLGVFPPDQLPVRLGGYTYNAKSLRANGITNDTFLKLFLGDPSVIADWKTADSGSFARACVAAFGAR